MLPFWMDGMNMLLPSEYSDDVRCYPSKEMIGCHEGCSHLVNTGMMMVDDPSKEMVGVMKDALDT